VAAPSIVALLPRGAAADDDGRFAVVVHLASQDERAARAWLEQQLATAGRHFERAGVGFAVVEERRLPASFCTVDDIPERIRLRRYLVERAINVVLVDRALDPVPSESTRRAARRAGWPPSGELAGAHILSGTRGGRARVPRSFVLVVRDGSEVTLTHELGHFFWLPHDKDPSNIMSYGDDRRRFSERQLKEIRFMASRYRRRKELRLVHGARSPAGGKSHRQ